MKYQGRFSYFAAHKTQDVVVSINYIHNISKVTACGAHSGALFVKIYTNLTFAPAAWLKTVLFSSSCAAAFFLREKLHPISPHVQTKYKFCKQPR